VKKLSRRGHNRFGLISCMLDNAQPIVNHYLIFFISALVSPIRTLSPIGTSPIIL
jgi:hypothetical protein